MKEMRYKKKTLSLLKKKTKHNFLLVFVFFNTMNACYLFSSAGKKSILSVEFIQGQVRVLMTFSVSTMSEFMIEICWPSPIHRMRAMATVKPKIAPFAFAQGKNMPRENRPRVTPPTMPLKLRATCITLPRWAMMKTWCTQNYGSELMTYD